jgi:hypothetical protein
MNRNLSMSGSDSDLLLFKVGSLVFEWPQGLEMAVFLSHRLLLIGEKCITWFQ